MTFNPAVPFDLPPLPPPLPPGEPDANLLIAARSSLAHLRGVCQSLDNPKLLLLLPTLQESLKSCEIEGIRTTIEAALEHHMTSPNEIKDHNTKEAICYKNAILKGHQSMERYALSTRTIQAIHGELMRNNGGVFCGQQNSIVDGTGKVVYTPPDITKLNPLLSNWEQYANSPNDNLDPLVRAAVCHYQFEAIHPFGDGNGRAGRILMVLQMIQDKLLDHPALYVSGYINEKRSTYYALLKGVTERENWKDYVEFILRAVAIQAQITTEIILEIKTLRTSIKRRMREQHKNIYNIDLLEHLFLHPITYPSFMASKLKITYQTAGKHLAALEKGGFLKKRKIGRKKLYQNTELINCLKKRDGAAARPL